MALSDRQIERYSRQIIVPGIGGRGQQRLLAARLALSGAMADLEAPLAYLVGAGVGTIFVEAAGGPPIDSRLIDDLRELNPDSRVAAISESPAQVDLAIMLIGGAPSLAAARAAIDRSPGRRLILARLDLPPRIAVLGAAPCPLCADLELLGPFGKRAENAAFVAMVATAEAIRILTDPNQPGAPRLIEFNGYQSHSVVIGRRTGVARCRCESVRSADG
ncbi:MAG TPA: ThiF family adenylyltransferase [Candidatus Binataceae bacterium]|nr:ThiF family adenylyltransferase [Candidatus Binataceae bacterium]